MTINTLGIYEKALPQELSWIEKFKLARQLGFNFVEFSIDESDERLERLEWSKKQRVEFLDAMQQAKMPIYNMMLSGHRRYPLGSKDPAVRQKALEMVQKAINLAGDLGIRNIQLAGYDVFYEEKTMQSRELFIENLKKCSALAAQKLVMLSIETMDDPFINSISKAIQYKKQIKTPWLQVYPDLGNLSAWKTDIAGDFENYLANVAAIHLKDTLEVTSDFAGKFKNVPFGEGCVDFEGLLRLLVRLEYAGSYTIEMWSGENPEVDPIMEIKQAKTYFDEIFTRVGIVQAPVGG